MKIKCRIKRSINKMNKALKYGLTLMVCVGLLTATFFIGVVFQKNTNLINIIDYNDVMQGIDYGEITYVIGHKSPDTDTVCSAIAYANLKQLLGVNCVPVVNSNLNNETMFVLKKFNTNTPKKLENATGKNMILVDHTAYSQAIDGMDKANILEIIDHHGLGDISTNTPIFIKEMPVGSTATIIYTSYIEYGVDMDQSISGLLASAILSDTSNLTLSTTTDLDRKALAVLTKKAGIVDINSYYSQLRDAAASYDGMTDEEIFYSDYKEYDMSGTSIGIASVNATGDETDDICIRMQGVMENIYNTQKMKHLYVMVNDNKNNKTHIAFYGDGSEKITEKAFGTIKNNHIILTPASSRKKDIVPPLGDAYADFT